MSDVNAIRIHAPAAIALLLASLVTLGAFGWPFILDPTAAASTNSHSSDAPWIFALILPLLAAIVLAELNAGSIDSKAIALLGMLAAVGGALRALSPGVAGLEPSFALIMLGGRVFGKGFGFVLGALSIFIGALITGGVGPWLPFQMMTAGWVGFMAGCLPRAKGRTEVLMLAALGFVLGLFYGALMNLWFWPFVDYGDTLSYVAGATPHDNLVNYARYYVTTSVIWDLARANFTFLLLLFVGRPLLRALRRVSRRAAFDAPVVFEPASVTPTATGSSVTASSATESPATESSATGR